MTRCTAQDLGLTMPCPLWPVLSDRDLVYGKWMRARHTIFCNALAHQFWVFDDLDQHSGMSGRPGDAAPS